LPQPKKKKRRVSTDYSDFADSRPVLFIIFLICVICEIGGYSSSGFERGQKFFEMLNVSSTEETRKMKGKRFSLRLCASALKKYLLSSQRLLQEAQ